MLKPGIWCLNFYSYNMFSVKYEPPLGACIYRCLRSRGSWFYFLFIYFIWWGDWGRGRNFVWKKCPQMTRFSDLWFYLFYHEIRHLWQDYVALSKTSSSEVTVMKWIDKTELGKSWEESTLTSGRLMARLTGARIVVGNRFRWQ